ncbi:MAG: family 16 glycosylhydrolase [Jatrophihabitantaceae bacterium]
MADTLVRPAERARYRQIALVLVGALLLAGLGAAAWYHHRPGWRLSWSDDFSGATLDPAKWQVEDRSTFGNGNAELACLLNRPRNVRLADGLLSLTAVRERTPVVCGDNDTRFPNGRDYTSAMVSTKGKQSWHEGRFEIRAKLPLTPGSSKGLWPAFWMRPAAGTGDGEIDVLEAVGTGNPNDPEANTVHQTLWYDENGTHPKQSQVTQVSDPAGSFHTYGVRWRDGKIDWYIDGKVVFSRDESSTPWLTSALAGRFFLRLNLAVGGTFPGTPTGSTRLPAAMVVDWVKVYQWRD